LTPPPFFFLLSSSFFSFFYFSVDNKLAFLNTISLLHFVLSFHKSIDASELRLVMRAILEEDPTDDEFHQLLLAMDKDG